MTWLAWRQFRTQAITAAVAVALFAVLLAITRPRMDGLYGASGLAGCHGGGCAGQASAFLNQLASAAPFTHSFIPLPDGFDLYPFVWTLSLLLTLAAPAIVGIFWGAPLIARELESGSYRLAWGQSVTRARWLSVKLVLIGAAAVAVTEAFSLLLAWWATPVGQAMSLGGSASVFSGNRFSPLTFATHGITPVGYAAFGFALGVTAGVLIRRAVPAMAVTLAVFAAVQVIMPLWVRPHLIPPQHAAIAIGRDVTFSVTSVSHGNPVGFSLVTSSLPGQPGAWIVSSGPVNAAGQAVRDIPAACAQVVARDGGSAALDCLSGQGIKISAAYQPASSYWAVQAAEAGLFLVLALGLAGACFWWLGHRRP